MPRYNFGSVDGDRDPDVYGVELANDTAARAYAIKYAGEVLQSDPRTLSAHGQWRVEVTDAEGHLLFNVVTLAMDSPEAAAVTRE